MKYSNNGLNMDEIESSVITGLIIKNLNSIKEYINSESFVVAYLDYKVIIGTYKNGNFNFYNDEQIDLESIQRIRIFNEDEELMLWRSDGLLKGRLRKDNVGLKCCIVDNNQILFGTRTESLNGYTLLKEDRGTEIIIPFQNFVMDEKIKGDRVKITTRNYVDFNEIHQATYVDCRFIGFTFGEENKPLEV